MKMSEIKIKCTTHDDEIISLRKTNWKIFQITFAKSFDGGAIQQPPLRLFNPKKGQLH